MGNIIINETIFYSTSYPNRCITKCKYTLAMVGTMGCNGCKHFVEKNAKQNIVICSYLNDKALEKKKRLAYLNY